MNFNLLSADEVEKIYLTIPEALLVALVGILIVFAILAVLIGILYLFKLVFGLPIFKDKKDSVNNLEAEMLLQVSDEETVAAITAAINLILESESAEKTSTAVTPAFRIKSIKRI